MPETEAEKNRRRHARVAFQSAAMEARKAGVSYFSMAQVLDDLKAAEKAGTFSPTPRVDGSTVW